MMGTNIHAKRRAIRVAHQGSPDLAAYVVPIAIAVVATKMKKYHQSDISLYT